MRRALFVSTTGGAGGTDPSLVRRRSPLTRGSSIMKYRRRRLSVSLFYTLERWLVFCFFFFQFSRVTNQSAVIRWRRNTFVLPVFRRRFRVVVKKTTLLIGPRPKTSIVQYSGIGFEGCCRFFSNGRDQLLLLLLSLPMARRTTAPKQTNKRQLQ